VDQTERVVVQQAHVHNDHLRRIQTAHVPRLNDGRAARDPDAVELVEGVEYAPCQILLDAGDHDVPSDPAPRDIVVWIAAFDFEPWLEHGGLLGRIVRPKVITARVMPDSVRTPELGLCRIGTSAEIRDSGGGQGPKAGVSAGRSDPGAASLLVG
jgi:hypothetical protein